MKLEGFFWGGGGGKNILKFKEATAGGPRYKEGNFFPKKKNKK